MKKFWLLRGTVMSKIQTLSELPISGSFFVVGYRYQPIATVGFGVCSRLSGFVPGTSNLLHARKGQARKYCKIKSAAWHSLRPAA